jgi:hypothetical protein
MHDYIRLWRLFPKLTLGILFLTSLITICAGPAKVSSLAPLLSRLDFKALGQVGGGIIALFALIGISSIGLYLLQITTAFIGSALQLAVRLTRASQFLAKTSLRPFIQKPEEFVLDYFRTSESAFKEFLNLRNTAVPEGASRTKQIKTHTDKTVCHLLSLKGFQLMTTLAFLSSFTQDQQKLKNAHDDILEIYFLWLTLHTVALSLWREGILHFNLFTFALLLLCASVVLYPLLRERIKTYGFFVVYAYLDNLTIGPMSPMQDVVDTK